MKLLTYAQIFHDLNLIKDQGITEVILGHRDYNRFGKLDDASFFEMSKRARELGLRIVFEWDILMTQKVFESLTTTINRFYGHFDALRVQDPGALEWALEQTDKPLQFIAENGNHNLVGLMSWANYAGKRLERIVLSIELTKTVIEEYVQKLSTPCELLGFGRILLFYTPRNLLSPLSSEKLLVNEELSALGESEESPHKGFPIVENRHGTFMFHIKEFCLLDFAHELKSFGLNTMRIDLRWESLEYLKTINSLVQNFEVEALADFKEAYSQDLMRGFYLVNKTDVLFPKLKNHRLQKREGDYIGEVIEAEKGSHLAIMVKNPRGLKKTDKLKIVHPEGKIFEVDIFSLKDLSLREVEIVERGKLALTQFVGGVWVKSHVFLNL